MNANPKIYFDLVNSLMETKEWQDIEKNDPIITSAYEEVFGTLENIKDKISIETLDSISRSIGDYASAKADCAALYGIQVAITMNEIIKDPSIYSNYIIEKYISKRK